QIPPLACCGGARCSLCVIIYDKLASPPESRYHAVRNDLSSWMRLFSNRGDVTRARPKMQRIRLMISLALLLVVATIDPPAAGAQAPRGPIYTVQVEGPVTSVTIGYLERALHLAEAANANVLIIQLSSSGRLP